MSEAIKWRVTPKSKAYKAIVPPTVLPGTVVVTYAEVSRIGLQISQTQAEHLRKWTRELPDDVIPPTACDTKVIQHAGPYSVVDAETNVGSALLPRTGAPVRVRVTASVSKLGALYKAHIQVVDVLSTQADVAAT